MLAVDAAHRMLALRHVCLLFCEPGGRGMPLAVADSMNARSEAFPPVRLEVFCVNRRSEPPQIAKTLRRRARPPDQETGESWWAPVRCPEWSRTCRPQTRCW